MRNHMVRAAVSVIAVVASVCIAGSTALATTTPQTKMQRGGSMVFVKVNQTWPTLDPAINSLATSENAEEDAIYGELFEQQHDGTITPDLATNWAYSNHNQTLTIFLRRGVTFTDGSPFNATAVQWNWQRDLMPANGCVCLPYFRIVTSITTKGSYTVVLHLSTAYAIAIQAFTASPMNWIISPTAFQSEGAATFGQHPVGAGPFEVVSNTASSTLVVQKNPHYWETGHPYLQQITFLGSVANDNSAYNALASGQANLIDSLSTVSLIDSAKSQGEVSIDGGVNALSVDFNTQKAPFNNILAREAISYATDPSQILNVASPGFGVVVQSPSGPGDGPFYKRIVPGYHAYNLSMATSLVSQLGGLTVQLQGGNTVIAEQEEAALQNQWQQAGIKVNLAPESSATSTLNVEDGNYEMLLANNGDPDPDIGIGSLLNRFGSTGSFSGVRDPALDGMINQSESFINIATRQKIIDNIYAYLAKNAYAVFLFDAPVPILATPNLTGQTLGYLSGNEVIYQFENIGFKA
jgi:peptide/nickel transport system substrate-binding protein